MSTKSANQHDISSFNASALFLPRIRLYELTASARTEDAEALGPQCVDALGEAHEEEVAQRGGVGAVAEECGEDGATWT
jgi:hypothetical protein